jgi:hypothetical protein
MAWGAMPLTKYEGAAWVFKPFFIFMPRRLDAMSLKG